MMLNMDVQSLRVELKNIKELLHEEYSVEPNTIN